MRTGDLIFVFVPMQGDEILSFQDWLAGTGEAKLCAATAADCLSAYQTVEGAEGVQILIEVPARPLTDGLTESVLRHLVDHLGETRSVGIQIGRFRFARNEVGQSAQSDPQAILVVGRAAGENHLDEFRAWYEDEHLVGLALLDGVIGVTRYDDVTDPSRSLAIYEMTDETVPQQSGWPLVGHTAWTRRIRSKYAKWLDFRSRRISLSGQAGA